MEKLSNTSIFDLFQNDNETTRNLLLIQRKSRREIILNEINDGYNFDKHPQDCLLKIYLLMQLGQEFHSFFDDEIKDAYQSMMDHLKSIYRGIRNRV